jgi:hypothetical protein
MTTLDTLTVEDRDAVRQVIRAARARINQGWTTGSFARVTHGWGCKADSEKATCWCILGALCAAVGVGDVSYFDPESHRTRPAWLAEGLLERRAGQPLPTWNDEFGRTMDDVLELLDAVDADLEAMT